MVIEGLSEHVLPVWRFSSNWATETYSTESSTQSIITTFPWKFIKYWAAGKVCCDWLWGFQICIMNFVRLYIHFFWNDRFLVFIGLVSEWFVLNITNDLYIYSGVVNFIIIEIILFVFFFFGCKSGKKRL